MKKRFLALSLIALATPIVLAGCDNKNNNQKEEEPQLVESVSLPVSSANLILGESYKLTPKFETNAPTMPLISYVSSDSTVASVDDQGNILATGVGDAVVTVHFGGVSTTCDVNVSLMDCVPLIRLENFYSDNLTIDLGSTVDLKAYVFFNTQKFACDFTYKSSSITAGSFDGTKYTPKKKGNIDITISGDFFGYKLAEKVVHLNVKEVVSFSLTKKGDVQDINSVYLYNYKTYGKYSYLTEFEFDCFVIEKGEKKAPTSIELVDNNEGAVIYDATNSKLTIKEKTVGTANLKVSYVDKLGETYSKLYPISVNYSFVPYEEGEPVQTLETLTGEVDTSEIFSTFDPADQKITVAQSADGKKNYEVVDGKIIGLEDHGDTVQTIRIGNGLILKEIKFTTISKFIRTAADLDMFRLVTDAEIEEDGNYCHKFIINNKRMIEGTYVLANDIDASGFTLKDRGRITGEGAGAFSPYGFRGTFDGQGHTISNLTFSRGGIFTCVGTDGVVKNVGFENAKFDAYNKEDRVVIGSYINNAVIQNVYVHVDKNPNINASGTICHNVNLSTIFKNCLIVMDDVSHELNCDFGYGALSSYCTSYTSLGTAGEEFMLDTYVVANCPLIKGQRFSTGDKFYYCDAENCSFDLIDKKSVDGQTLYPKYTIPHIKHFKTMADYEESTGNDYSSFSSKYWEVKGNTISWKMN